MKLKYYSGAQVTNIIEKLPSQEYLDMLNAFAKEPSADVEEVVRCKDCKFYNHLQHYCDGIGYWFGLEDEWSDNGFCYKGERIE